MSQEKKTKDVDNDQSPKLPMDVKHLKNLIELMVVNDLSRLELREGDSHILLRRGQPVVATTPMLHAANPGPARPAATSSPPPSSPPLAPNQVLIRSPMVGTFYAAPDPESPPFVTVGSIIEPNSVVCLIEAMKVFNELKAEVSGQITKILVKNGDAVEFDQPLFAVEPA
jgi:acetyl-CoA carboxylase biotin carboxyl carrier protein